MKKTLLLLLIFSIYKVSFACDCKARTIDTAYVNSDIVIHGFVISESIYKLEQSVDYLDSLSEKLESVQFGPNRVKEYKILILANYKTDTLTDTLIVRTNANSNCQVTLEPGKEYILFAQGIDYMDRLFDINTDKHTFQTNQCSNTTMFDRKKNKMLIKLKGP